MVALHEEKLSYSKILEIFNITDSIISQTMEVKSSEGILYLERSSQDNIHFTPLDRTQ